MQVVKFDECTETLQPIRFNDGEEVTLQLVKQILQEKFDSHGISVDIQNDQLKSGGLFSSTMEDCLTITNSEHRNNYYRYLILLKRQGSFAFLNFFIFGSSKQINNLSNAEILMQGKSGVGGWIMKGIANIGVNQSKVHEEQLYYESVASIIKEAFI